MSNIRYLGESMFSKGELALLGGKAAKLHELKGQGYSVPAGFVLEGEVSDLSGPIQKIGGFPVAVRSSCSMEDLPNASFAGLYETFLFVKDEQELSETIQKCFASKFSDRVKDYLITKNIKASSEQLQMSVLVQKMVDAKIAGVLFTLNPVNGFEEEIYFEYCAGVGERLVSGHVTPSRCRYNWREDKIVSHEINHEGTKISKQSLQKLIQEALKIQAYFGIAQDIEWAIDKEENLFILQSRPVTTFSPREDFPEVTNADLKDGGISARVCTPFMYSVYRDALKISMGDYFKRLKLIPNDENITWIYYAYGRVYWNAGAVKEGVKKIPGFREEDFDRDLGIQKHYENGPFVTPMSLSHVVNAIPVMLGLMTEFRDSMIMVDHFREAFEVRDEALKEKLSKLNKLSWKEFREWMLKVIQHQQQTEKSYFRVIYNNANYQSEFKGLLKKLPGYEAGDEVDLMGELHGVSHLDVQTGLAKLKKAADFYGFFSNTYYSEREQFLKTHYHHGPAELDITVPRWGENKEWVDELVKSFVATKNVTGSYQKTREKILKSTPIFQKAKFIGMLDNSRSFLRMREEMRAYSTRAYYLLRLGMLEFANRMSWNELDIFMLDLQEVKQKLINYEISLPDIQKRKIFYQGYKNFKAPNEFGGTIKLAKSGGELKGLGCSPGEIVGVARVIKDIHATHELTKNDILVTSFTDPGWTPVLARVGGVITEVGGLLSHAAVIGREYGIPAILNLIDATILIQDGDKIRMNGKTGEVEILEKRS